MPSCEEEVLSIGRKLEKVIDGSKSPDGAFDLLETLSSLPINIEVLTKTRIGMKLNDLRKKTSDERLAKKAKQLIKMSRNDSSSNLSGKSSDSGSNKAPVEKKSSSASISSTQTSASFPPKHLAHDDLRCKSIVMLLSSLRSGELPDGTLDPEELAIKIEEKLHDVQKGTGEKYKSALRSRVFNLRGEKNKALRENVLTGVVKPEKFAVMTSEEMASDEIKQLREKFTKEAINEHQMSVTTGTPSDMFMCGKCRKKNCTYTQLQTRSADEPMTTFVYCLECGNRWKFC